jgi:hypothetical protein
VLGEGFNMRLEPSDTTQSRKVKIIKCNKCKKPYSSGEYTYDIFENLKEAKEMIDDCNWDKWEK